MTKESKQQLITQAIEDFKVSITTSETGKVISVFDGIAIISGLQNCLMGEIVVFESKNKGLVISLDENFVTVLIIGTINSIKNGEEVQRTQEFFKIECSDKMLGRVLNGFGEPIDNNGDLGEGKFMNVENDVPQLTQRDFITQQLETGIKIIDILIPVGLGQRQLIAGDANTGKTNIVLSTILNNKNNPNFIAVYVSIGQQVNNASKFLNKMKQNNVKNFIIVNANNSDSSTMRYLAPMVGCSIAEYFRDQGKDVLIAYDDLSSHAIAYREISLILKNPPGREAYPGDIFFLHSRLLERAANLNQENGGGSLTALPIVKTFDGDISSYVCTNLISITDGQIILTQEQFVKNFRPAIDITRSVSRIGSNCQNSVLKNLTKSIKIEYANFKEYEEMTKMSSSVSPEIQSIIKRGYLITKILSQNLEIVEIWKQICILYGLRQNLYDIKTFPDFIEFVNTLDHHKEDILKKEDVLEGLFKDFGENHE